MSTTTWFLVGCKKPNISGLKYKNSTLCPFAILQLTVLLEFPQIPMNLTSRSSEIQHNAVSP